MITSFFRSIRGKEGALALSIVALAIAIGMATRLVAVFRYADFQDDQVWNVTKIVAMQHGEWPSLGPYSSVGEYSLPPLFYYLSFPFTLPFGSDPVGAAFANAVISFLTIPLIVAALFVALETLPPTRRMLIAGLVGLWWSLLFQDILLSNAEWNPPMVPFFLLASALCAVWLWRSRTPRRGIPLACLLGFLLAILASLHSSTLFTMPIASLLLAFIFFIKRPRQWYLPVVVAAAACIALLPYWKGEFATDWANTRAIWDAVTEFGGEQHSILAHIDRAVQNYLELGQSLLFPGVSVSSLGAVFLGAIVVLSALTFRGNRTLAVVLAIVWLVYGYVASNFWHPFLVHYKVLIWVMPLFLWGASVAYLPQSKWQRSVLVAFLGVFFLLSCWSNGAQLIQYLDARYGPDRLVTTKDFTELLRSIPEGSSVCASRADLSALQYLDEYRVKRSLTIIADCPPGTYEIIPRCRVAKGYTKPVDCRDPEFSQAVVVVETSGVATVIQHR
jgi:hypothetical protein